MRTVATINCCSLSLRSSQRPRCSGTTLLVLWFLRARHFTSTPLWCNRSEQTLPEGIRDARGYAASCAVVVVVIMLHYGLASVG